MKPRNLFLLTLILGGTGIPRILNKDFISGAILFLLGVFVFSSMDENIFIWIGLFDAVTSLFYREPEPKKQSEEDRNKVTRSMPVTKDVQKEKIMVTKEHKHKIGNKICGFCGAPIPSNEKVCSYCRMESTQ